MSSSVRVALVLVVLMALSGSLRAAEPRVSAELSHETIYLGESVRYRVKLHDFEEPVEPTLPGFEEFSPQAAGRSMGVQSTVIINGKLQSFSRGEPEYEYVLTPKRSGKLRIPPPVVVVGGQKIEGPALHLEVRDPDQQDIVVMELKSEPPEVYPLQPFTLKLTVAIKNLPEPAVDREPVSVQQQLPQLIIPWADDESLPAGVKAMRPASEWLQRLLDERQKAGFGINNFRTRGGLGAFGMPDLDELLSRQGFPDEDSLFSVFNRENRAAFHPPPKRTLREDRQGRKVGYWEYTFERTFQADQLGDVSFGPATLKGVFATRSNTRGDMEGERIYAVAKAINVRVKDAPLADRPPSYTGAIGRFEAGAELTPTQAKVGDPMTLTVWLRGQGTLDNATAPKLSQHPEIAKAFRTYEATEQTTGDTRRFTYSLRPQEANITEFPSIELSYFDIHEEKYKTLRTDPIPLEIAAADRLAASDVAIASTPTTTESALEVQAEGIFANVVDLSELRNESVRAEIWWLTWGVLLAGFATIAVARRHFEHVQSDTLGQRRRGALRRARERLSAAQSHVAAGARRPAADAMNGAITGLVADVAGIAEQGLTSGEVARHLHELDVEPDLVSQVTEALESCDAARYGALQHPLAELHEQITRVVEDLGVSLRNKKLVS